jgi:hypothetical protein
MVTPPTRTSAASSSGTLLYGIYVGALATALVGNLFIRLGTEAGWLPQAARTVLAAVSVLPLVAAVFVFWRLLRHEFDEMQQRIVLEGMATGLTLYIPMAAIYTNLSTAGVHMPRLDPPELLLAPAWLVALGVMLAARRYR